jgi:hypothetical protein
MSTTSPFESFPRYRCHKVVRALKIQAHDEGTLFPADKNFPAFEGGAGYWRGFHAARKTWPENQTSDYGYFVVYDDGYTSYSPTQAFESGYVLEEERLAKARNVVAQLGEIYRPPALQAELERLLHLDPGE